MSAPVARLIPRVSPVNPRAHADVRHQQVGLDDGLTEAVNALLAATPFALDRSQCEHVARLVLLHALYAVEDGTVADLLAGLVDRLDRECWLLDGGAQ